MLHLKDNMPMLLSIIKKLIFEDQHKNLSKAPEMSRMSTLQHAMRIWYRTSRLMFLRLSETRNNMCQFIKPQWYKTFRPKLCEE